jgi:hypothetical protein
MNLKIKSLIEDELEGLSDSLGKEIDYKRNRIISSIIKYRDNGGKGQILYNYLVELSSYHYDEDNEDEENFLDDILRRLVPDLEREEYFIPFSDIKRK